MVTKSQPAVALLFMGICLSLTSRAEEIPEVARVPIVVAHVERQVENHEVDRIAEDLGAPFARGSALLKKLSLVAPLEEGFSRALMVQFEKAQDDFFSGKHKEAEDGFADIIARAEASPNSLAAPSTVRELVFKAHIYRAIVARGEKNEKLASGQIEIAVKNYFDLSPNAVDFPPWVIEEFESRRGVLKSGFGSVVLRAPEDCTLSLQGEKHSPSKPIENIPIGNYALSAECSGKHSPPQRLFVSESEVVFQPIVLRKSDLIVGENDVILRFEDDVTNTELVRDVISLARSGGWERMVVVVGRDSSTKTFLVDSEVGGVVRSVSNGKWQEDSLESMDREIDLVNLRADKDHKSFGSKPWYKDGLAWTLVGTGLSAFCGGLAMARIYGDHSEQEFWAWTLLAAGAGTFGTGVLLFFAPQKGSLPSGEKSTAMTIGLRGQITF